MATCWRFVSSEVLSFIAELTEDVAWEVPVEIDTIPTDSRVRSLSDEPKTVLVGFLEHERGIIAT